MAGIYLHIPFCKQACYYCDFHFSTSLSNKNSFISALKKEIALQKNYLGGNPVSTVYFGGGTPSLLSYDEIMAILDALHKHHPVSEKAEITLEANPDDLSINKTRELKKTPVNRLSIGIQSFYDEELRWMNRAHNSVEATEAVKIAQGEGFENISVDLIYGIPALSNEKWINNIECVLNLNVQHISAYCLTVEPRTALADFIKKGKTRNISDAQGADHFKILTGKLIENDFIHYEIANFCKEGFISNHNSNYWRKKNYLGLGPSAHSYNGSSRQWNVSNNVKYVRAMEKNESCFEMEALSADDNYNEYVMTSLRTMWGTDLNYIHTNFSESYVLHIQQEAAPYIRSGDIINRDNKLLLTNNGKLLADRIAGDFFITRGKW